MSQKQKADRIYIFIPRTLESGGIVNMSSGRAAAQCAHAAAKLVELGYENISNMTTIILAAANFDHLERIIGALNDFKISYELQCDTYENDEFSYLQAVITHPVTEEQAKIFKFVEMW